MRQMIENFSSRLWGGFECSSNVTHGASDAEKFWQLDVAVDLNAEAM
ncbi:hypothetical protein [Lacticaseibacillus nasuensis]|nr:hypothetical protein [Lacticaseibacillus nasuensis]MCX2455282.1 hypothetical protein [Lacticaseibacillus nasuensis]